MLYAYRSTLAHYKQFFDEWKGKQEQIDDVLLVGIAIKDPMAFGEIHEFLYFD